VDAREIDWPRYDQLKAQGYSGRQIAQALGVAESTLRGLVKRRQEHQPEAFISRVSGQTPGVPKRVPNRASQRVSDRVPEQVLAPSLPAASTSDMAPLLHDILQELRTLTQGLAGRVSPQTPPVSTETPRVPERVSNKVSKAVPIAPREKTERWNLHLPIDLITKIKAKAQALGVHPSELVAEVLRQWLAEER
jgi:lambda repressor-like predicted transcriptional regulator/predicted DNA binding CopG/RHH family protein